MHNSFFTENGNFGLQDLLPSWIVEPLDMEISPQDVTDWLKETKKSRKWLADQCGVKYSTLSNQMSMGKLSRAVTARIALLMTQTRGPEARFTPEQWDRIEKAWRKGGYKDREEFFVAAINEKVDAVLGE